MKNIQRLILFIRSIFIRMYFRWKGWPVKANYKIISLGMGQQSMTMYLMSCTGELERADFAIFADTGAESRETYQMLKWLKKWSKRNKGIPIIHRKKRSLYADLFRNSSGAREKFAPIPAFIRKRDGTMGMLKRECTDDYKTNEIYKVIRRLYGLKPKQRMPGTEMWLGISLEEKDRVSVPRHRWLTFVYPFVNIVSNKGGMKIADYTRLLRRSDCTTWLGEKGFPIPPKSACVFCPYQSDARWREMKRDAKCWRKILKLDKHLRSNANSAISGRVYLHRSGIALEKADLKENQLDLFGCNSGMCGV